MTPLRLAAARGAGIHRILSVPGDIQSIDHLGFGVRNLAAAAQRMRHLGFTLTSYAEHTRTDERGRLVNAGSAQYSAMLAHGYLAVLGIADTSARHPVADRIGHYTGLHHLQFGVTDAARARGELDERGVFTSDIVEWERPVMTGGVTRMARFRYFAVSPAETPEGVVGFVEQLTPEVLRPAHLLEHRNRARGLAGVVICAARPGDVALRYRNYLNRYPEVIGSGFVFSLPSGQEVCILDEDGMEAMLPGYIAPAPTCLAAGVVQVDDVVAAREVIVKTGTRVKGWAHGVWMEGGLALGGALAFAKA